ncbi:hypothetical protein KXD40_000126 [Peronospora effusa]|uniref:CUE domain-containing protein n=1 Tax=Peronospora effusa TaxID=542832 RepID=A0A3M6VQ23_9STRA|nr:hypothetical protein DD238_006299 [Peronospora effusa]RQM14816.1 hypothetical protein DD237_006187 [Peronospora effusa]UIZ20622.1 hypothetical protein KXD40_000126 [Peronospora effusa]CAI5705263.1 unnamed protein product [Peronospora effusa]
MADELIVLRSMFPSWDVEVLEELLAAHQGSVERTVDSMLAMDAISSAGIKQAPQPPPTLAQSPGSPTRRQPSSISCPSSSPRGKPQSRIKLPDDFLRLPMDECLGMSEQEERDAMLARMLQDQFFRDEVLSSEEFSSHFHDGRSNRQTQAPASEKTAAEIANEAYVAMSEKFTSLSEVMKSKMHNMYMRVQTRNDTLASTDPKSARPLMQSDSESSESEDLDDNSDVRRRNMDHYRSQGSSRRRSAPNTTGKPNIDIGASSKKDD